jgi:hypothetical protein
MSTFAAQPSSAADPGSILDSALRRRAELYDSVKAVIRALEAASPGRESEWLRRVQQALDHLRDEFHEHVETTESPEGVHAQMLHDQPRLAARIRRLSDEHVIISDRVDAVTALAAGDDPADVGERISRIRDAATEVVAMITRHRQRSADVVYEAYNTDIGLGE